MEADGAGEQMRPLLTRVTSRVRAAGDGPPRLGGGGAERDRQRRGRGMRRGPATTSGARRPSTAPRPVRLAIPFVWLPRARVRGGGRPRRGGGPTGGGRQRATRILATGIFGTAGARPRHLRRARPPALDPDHLFLSLRSTRYLIPGRSPRPGSQFRWP